jgi:hypothetical protein
MIHRGARQVRWVSEHPQFHKLALDMGGCHGKRFAVLLRRSLPIGRGNSISMRSMFPAGSKRERRSSFYLTLIWHLPSKGLLYQNRFETLWSILFKSQKLVAGPPGPLSLRNYTCM